MQEYFIPLVFIFSLMLYNPRFDIFIEYMLFYKAYTIVLIILQNPEILYTTLFLV
jgi:hypothetical protein